MGHLRRAHAALLLAMLVGVPACRTLFPKHERPPVVEDAPPPLPVRRAPEEVVVAAWAEPKVLPPGGGQAQILVRAQRRGGAPFSGVEVRIRSSAGSLYSQGRVLVTDKSGRTRDRLTTREPATVTVNAGGTVYRLLVPLHEPEHDQR